LPHDIALNASRGSKLAGQLIEGRRSMMRMVPGNEWQLSEETLDPSRRERLLDLLRPEGLLIRFLAESVNAARDGRVGIHWQKACEAPGYFRLTAQIPIQECVFDQLFNGRCGYRAQYYLSPEEGILFNRTIVRGLKPVICRAYELTPLEADLELVLYSLTRPHAKIWIYKEQEAFGEAAKNSLNPQRWVENGATLGRRAPLPQHYTVDLKGAFIHPKTKELFVDELKLSRPCDLHCRGFS
jgi:hypothetical protein